MENLGNGKQDDATFMPLKNKTRRSESEVVGYLKENLEQGARNWNKEDTTRNGRQAIPFPDGHDGTAKTATMVGQNKLKLSFLSKLVNC